MKYYHYQVGISVDKKSETRFYLLIYRTVLFITEVIFA